MKKDNKKSKTLKMLIKLSFPVYFQIRITINNKDNLMKNNKKRK